MITVSNATHASALLILIKEHLLRLGYDRDAPAIKIEEKEGYPPMTYNTKGCVVTIALPGISEKQLLDTLVEFSRITCRIHEGLAENFYKQIDKMVDDGTF